MSDKEFIQWLRGFVEGVHHYNLSPKQWDYLKEKLKQVKTNSSEYTVSDRWTTNIS
jgi:hypothetical protein